MSGVPKTMLSLHGTQKMIHGTQKKAVVFMVMADYGERTQNKISKGKCT